ncbi:MAG: hypothetical protein WBA77_05495 [Microcoleaceae cyanobacterium]
MIDPHYPDIVLSFTYRGFFVEIEQDSFKDQEIYAVWVNSQQGCAVAVPCALSRSEAVKKAKRWIDQRLVTNLSN